MADEPRQEHEIAISPDGGIRENFVFRDATDIRKLNKINIGWTETTDVQTWGANKDPEMDKLPVMLLGSTPMGQPDAETEFLVYLLTPHDVISMAIQCLQFFNGTDQVIATLQDLQERLNNGEEDDE